MFKITITLPNGAQITLESDSELSRDILELTLCQVQGDLGSAPASAAETGPSDLLAQLADSLARLQALLPNPREAGEAQSEERRVTPRVKNSPEPNSKSVEGESEVLSPVTPAADGESKEPEQQAFVRFCRSVNPLGDMRRVVAAAEGAARYLDTDGVDAEELYGLFEQVGWNRPHDMTQSLRNAARSKFRWLERVPGRSGRYRVTEKGRGILQRQ